MIVNKRFNLIIALSHLILLSFFLLNPKPTVAAAITYSSDRLSNSAISRTTDQTINFTISSVIPASGKIVVTPQAGGMTIPTILDLNSVDLLVDGVNRSLTTTPGSGASSAYGLSIVSGASGSLTFTLNNTDTIAANSQITVLIGQNATYGATGSQRVILSSTSGSYRLDLKTTDSSGATIDQSQTRFVVTKAVTLTVSVDSSTVPNMPPTISLTSPTNGATLTTPTSVTLSATAADADGAVAQVEFYANGALLAVDDESPYTKTWSSVPIGTYNIYARVIDNVNRGVDSSTVTITVSDPVTTASGGGGGGNSSSGGGSGGDSSSSAAPLAVATEIVTVEKTSLKESNSNSKMKIESFPDKVVVNIAEVVVKKGTIVYIPTINDKKLEIIFPHSSDQVLRVYMPKGFSSAGTNMTLALSEVAVSSAAVRGLSVLIGANVFADNHIYQIQAFLDGNKGEIKSLPAPIRVEVSYKDQDFVPESVGLYYSNGGGDRWHRILGAVNNIATKTMIVENLDHLTFFTVMGVPKIISPTCGGDLNGDGRTNITDFSILLYNWKIPKNPKADLNADGKVNLVDLSMMLYCWTR